MREQVKTDISRPDPSCYASGNSVAMLNLLRLTRVTNDQELEDKARKIADFFSAEIAQYPSAHTFILCALDFLLGPSFEIVITGEPENEDTRKMLKVLREIFLPNKVVLFLPLTDDKKEILKIAPFLKDFSSADSKAKAFICTNYSCQKPADTAEELIKLINENIQGIK